MMGGKVDADKILKNFQASLDLSKNMKPLMLLILGKGFETGNDNAWTLRGSVMQAFAAKRGPMNKKSWAPLSPGYFKDKQRHFPGQPTLVRTRLLLDTLQDAAGTYGSEDGTGAAVVVMTNTQLQYGTTVPYAGYLQGGINTGKRRMPPRQFLGISSTNMNLYKKLIGRYVSQTMMGQKPDGKVG